MGQRTERADEASKSYSIIYKQLEKTGVHLQPDKSKSVILNTQARRLKIT